MATVDVRDILTDSIRDDEGVSGIAEAARQPTFTLPSAKVLRRYLDTVAAPPEPILDAIAVALHVEDYDDTWTTSQKQSRLRDAIRWHRLKGTPRGIVFSLERKGVPYTRIFEKWGLTPFLQLETSVRFDETTLDTQPLDQFQPGSYYNDDSLTSFEYWVALRPGWGPANDYQEAIEQSGRAATRRLSLQVPTVSTTRTGTSVTQNGKFDEAIDIPDGATYDVDEGPNRGGWALSSWVYVDPTDMDADGVLLTVNLGSGNRVELRRDGTTSSFELIARYGGMTVFDSAAFSLTTGWHYLTLRRDDDSLSALDEDVTLAQDTRTERERLDWTPALGYRPDTSGAHANTRYSAPFLWRKAPSDSELTEQASRPFSFSPTSVGTWPSYPIDR